MNRDFFHSLNQEQKKEYEKLLNQNERLVRLNLKLTHSLYKFRNKLSEFVKDNEDYLISSEKIYEIFEMMQDLKSNINMNLKRNDE